VLNCGLQKVSLSLISGPFGIAFQGHHSGNFLDIHVWPLSIDTCLHFSTATIIPLFPASLIQLSNFTSNNPARLILQTGFCHPRNPEFLDDQI
jgi:hypothetical protein